MKKKIKTLKSKIYNLSISYVEYLRQKRKNSIFFIKNTDKALVLKLSNQNIYHRYFYTFLKFYSIEGYSIFLPDINYNYFRKNIYSVKRQRSDYYNLIFKEGLIIFGSPSKRYGSVIELNDKNISPDYFTPFLQNENNNIFHVPMTMHPLFYHNNYWNKKVHFVKNRKKSIFMAGNIDKNTYSAFNKTPFEMESRIAVVDYLNKSNRLKGINSNSDLNIFFKSDDDNACIILDSRENSIKMYELRNIIRHFYFYLALPGVIMPHSHNIIEALSVGTIPIIHEKYAKLMSPKLEHMKNAILYSSLEDIEIKMDLSYNLNDEVLHELKNNVYQYYKENLTPKSVINKITQNSFDLIYLQAETLSVNIFENSLM